MTKADVVTSVRVDAAHGNISITYDLTGYRAVFALAWCYVEKRGLSVSDAIREAVQFLYRWGAYGVEQEVRMFATCPDNPVLDCK